MKQAVLRAIRQLGVPVCLQKDGRELRFVAHIQSRRSGSVQGEARAFGRFGEREPQLYDYYGPADGDGAAVAFGDVLTTERAEFRVLRCRDFFAGDEHIFRLAVLERTDGGDEHESAD